MTDYAAAPALLAAAQETIRQLADENAALLAANTRLRGERDRARDLAVRSGIFEGATPATLRAQERLEWEQPEPDDDVIGVTDYTGPVQDGDDSVTWGRVHRAGEGGEHSEWKGYKDGNKVYLDWPELVRRWGPITPTMRTDQRIDLLAALQASITRHKLRAALDGDEQLTVVTLTQPCGCPVGEGHRCNPPF